MAINIYDKILNERRKDYEKYGDVWLENYINNLQGYFLINGKKINNLVTNKGKQMWMNAIVGKIAFGLDKLWLTSDNTTPAATDTTANFRAAGTASHVRGFELPAYGDGKLILSAFLTVNEANWPIKKLGVIASCAGQKILFAEQLKDISSKTEEVFFSFMFHDSRIYIFLFSSTNVSIKSWRY